MKVKLKFWNNIIKNFKINLLNKLLLINRIKNSLLVYQDHNNTIHHRYPITQCQVFRAQGRALVINEQNL